VVVVVAMAVAGVIFVGHGDDVHVYGCVHPSSL
jgi:hypothetical protein